jgi:UDP-3-O-acyl-N-acetylglucosamine deacetylase
VISPRRAPGCSYTYELDYGPPTPGVFALGQQRATWDGSATQYASEVAPARTYCLEQEAMVMRSMGLFAHLTPREMLVLGTSGPIDNALRFDDEPARHKLLDLIGDLALIGAPLQADVVATRSGHALAHEAARAVLGSSV